MSSHNIYFYGQITKILTIFCWKKKKCLIWSYYRSSLWSINFSIISMLGKISADILIYLSDFVKENRVAVSCKFFLRISLHEMSIKFCFFFCNIKKVSPSFHLFNLCRV